VEQASVGGHQQIPQIVARTTAERTGTGARQARLDRLTPLLRDLLTWELVERSESGAFQLCEDVQRRLAEESSRRDHPSTAVFVGRSCQRCGAVGVTRMVDGVRSCPSCSQLPLTDGSPPSDLSPAEPASVRHVRHGPPSWWNRMVG
jgi:hypothetical protein